MNLSSEVSRRDAFKLGLAGFGALALGSLVDPLNAYAATTTLSSKNELVPLDVAIPLNKGNCKVTWHGVSGKVLDTTNERDFFVPSKGSKGNWSYEDFADFDFSGNKIGDREIHVKITCDKLTVTDSCHKSDSTIDSYFNFASVTKNNEFWFNGVPYNKTYDSVTFQWFLDYTVIVTWADTGDIVDIPFYQVLSDVDAGSTVDYYKEAWTAKDGFTGDFYIYDKCYLKQSGNTFRVPSSDTSLSVTGNDSLIKAGLIALTENGNFSGQFEEGGCGTQVQLFSNFSSLSNPKKTATIER